MPLLKGSSPAIKSQNISEFHAGPTYAHTKAKFGKKRANAQAIAAALATARRSRAEGGSVTDNSPIPFTDSHSLDKYRIKQIKPRERGDDEMELDPTSDYPIPSSPNQNWIGDEILNGPQFSYGVRGPYADGGSVEDRNRPYVRPIPSTYNTNLGAAEPFFREWVSQNKVPFDPDAKGSDYDMRGFWRGLVSGDPRAASAVDPNDSRLHYPDYWKTPSHETFSNQSQWATPEAPQWSDQDQLVDQSGRIIFDDRKSNGFAWGGPVSSDPANTGDAGVEYAPPPGVARLPVEVYPTAAGPGDYFESSWQPPHPHAYWEAARGIDTAAPPEPDVQAPNAGAPERPSGRATPPWTPVPQSKYWKTTHGDWSYPSAEEQAEMPNAPAINRLFGLQGVDRYQTFPERMVRDVGEGLDKAAKDPSWVYSPEASEWSFNTASMLAAGSRLTGVPEGSAGIFGGRLATNADVGRLAEAESMRAAGESEGSIWRKTGWAWDKHTGTPIFEIPDQGASLAKVEQHPLHGGQVMLPTGSEYKLGDVLNHDRLYKAYPWMKDIPVKGGDPFDAQGAGGAATIFGKEGPKIQINPADPSRFLSSALHESQHIVQFYEGMSPGGNWRDFLSPKVLDDERILEQVKNQTEGVLRKNNIQPSAANGALRRYVELKQSGKLDELPIGDKLVINALRNDPDGMFSDIDTIVRARNSYNQVVRQAFQNYLSTYGEAMARNTEQRATRQWLLNKIQSPHQTMEPQETIPSLRSPQQPWKWDPDKYRQFFYGEEPAAQAGAAHSMSQGDFERGLEGMGYPRFVNKNDILDHLTGLEDAAGESLSHQDIAGHLIDFAKAGHGNAALEAKLVMTKADQRAVNKALWATANKTKDAATKQQIMSLYKKKTEGTPVAKQEADAAPKPPTSDEDFLNKLIKFFGEEAHPIDPGEEYYAAQEKQAMRAQAPEWQPQKSLTDEEGYAVDDLFSDLDPKTLPHDIFEKAKVLGLNQPGYHGTHVPFEAFKLPEDLPHKYYTTDVGEAIEDPRRPEIGIHFGTRQAANDRINQSGSGKGDEEPHIIPAIIKADNPFRMRDLGVWHPDSIASELRSSHTIDRKLIDAAMAVPSSPQPWKAYYDWERSKQQIINLRRLLEDQGYDSIAYRNNHEDPGSISYITWQPSKIRSFYAKFDPSLKHLAHLAAGIGGVGLFAMGSQTRDRDKDKDMTKRASGGSTPFHLRGYQASIGAPSADAEPGVRHFSVPRTGMIHSAVPGRTDKLNMNVKGGSYILPADIVSGIGQGNSMAGSAILNSFFKMGPYGAGAAKDATPKVNFGKAMPAIKPLSIKTPKFAKGGKNEDHGNVPIVAAGGEFSVPPEVVLRVGNGNMKEGHRALDHFVLHMRKKIIKDIKGLKPPKR